MAETEAVINSRSLTVNMLSNVNSEIPLSPSHLRTMKTYVILPPPQIFSKSDIYSRRRWRRFNTILMNFGYNGRKNFLKRYKYDKWKNQKLNFKVGYIVLPREDCTRNKWPMTKTVETEPHSTGVNCSVKLKLGDASLDSQKVLRWPISEMVFLVEDELLQFPDEENHW